MTFVGRQNSQIFGNGSQKLNLKALSLTILLLKNIFNDFLFTSHFFTRQVIGGELQDRLMPVPFSKNTTDQAVSAENKLFVSFLLLYTHLACLTRQ